MDNHLLCMFVTLYDTFKIIALVYTCVFIRRFQVIIRSENSKKSLYKLIGSGVGKIFGFQLLGNVLSNLCTLLHLILNIGM